MSFKSEHNGLGALAKYFATFSLVSIGLWILFAVLMWGLSRFLPFWAIALLIIGALVAVVFLGARQDPAKRKAMSDHITMRK